VQSPCTAQCELVPPVCKVKWYNTHANRGGVSGSYSTTQLKMLEKQLERNESAHIFSVDGRLSSRGRAPLRRLSAISARSALDQYEQRRAPRHSNVGWLRTRRPRRWRRRGSRPTCRPTSPSRPRTSSPTRTAPSPAAVTLRPSNSATPTSGRTPTWPPRTHAPTTCTASAPTPALRAGMAPSCATPRGATDRLTWAATQTATPPTRAGAGTPPLAPTGSLLAAARRPIPTAMALVGLLHMEMGALPSLSMLSALSGSDKQLFTPLCGLWGGVARPPEPRFD